MTSEKIKSRWQVSGFCDLTRDPQTISVLKDVPPSALGSAATRLRAYFASLEFRETVLNPFTSHPIDYKGEVIDVPGVGQLRFNTEPEIWENRKHSERFFSISTLFRREAEVNLLRRPGFSIVDFYLPGTPEAILSIFEGLLRVLGDGGMIGNLHRLSFDHAQYDPSSDGPRVTGSDARWVVTGGYDAASSFFEIDESGRSTRGEIFLVTPRGFLEIAALGRAGWNRNPDYVFRPGGADLPKPPLRLCGMGFGLERLLLAEQVLTASGARSKG